MYLQYKRFYKFFFPPSAKPNYSYFTVLADSYLCCKLHGKGEGECVRSLAILPFLGRAVALWGSCFEQFQKKKKGNNVGVLFFFVVVLFSRRLPPHLGKCLQRKEKMADGKR